MSIEQPDQIDFATIDHASGDVWLTIADHLPWNGSDEQHLRMLEEKINSYLRFIESGEMTKKIPDAKGRRAVINLIAKFPPSDQAMGFVREAADIIKGAGYELRFNLMRPR